MSAFLEILRFELRYYLRRISTWVYFGVLFLISWTVTASRAGAWREWDLGSDLLLANSPLRITTLMLTLGILAVPVTSAIAGTAIFRDFETRAYPLFFTTPTPKWADLGGRYLGAVLANLLVMLGIPLGAATAASLPFTDPDRIASYGAGAYALPFALMVVPNVLATAALFLVMGALSRKFVAVQVGGLALLLGWSISRL
ncbi:MAG: hypothetical protein KY464_13150, partial [Gemmatimonadetes bacterium]|nr:hypothetical protein [Gemmatimonadota bacterium]